MEITVERYVSNEDSTLSRISIDGMQLYYGLEDAYREVKVPGKTRIPAGRYAVVPRYEGRHYTAYRKLWAWHRGTLHVTNVPGFQWIMIHVGNTDADTEGCLLVGKESRISNGMMSVINSRAAYVELYQKVIEAAERGELWIEYIDNDRP